MISYSNAQRGRVMDRDQATNPLVFKYGTNGFAKTTRKKKSRLWAVLALGLVVVAAAAYFR